jgi:hypothetical protein
MTVPMLRPRPADPSRKHLQLGKQMRTETQSGWYTGDQASLERHCARRFVPGATEPELMIQLLLTKDRMHHSVGWWKNAEFEYCVHLSVSGRDRLMHANRQAGPYEQIPRNEVRYWAAVIFGEHVDKLWCEPGGTDPRLTREEARSHAKLWHLRLFLDPETFEPFIPHGEVYTLTRWIEGLTPAKVDR